MDKIKLELIENNYDIYFRETCMACPQQYDVYSSYQAFKQGNTEIGYVILRWGILYCEIPFNGETVFEHTFDDDLKGCFDNKKEKKTFLNRIKQAIINYVKNENNIS